MSASLIVVCASGSSWDRAVAAVVDVASAQDVRLINSVRQRGATGARAEAPQWPVVSPPDSAIAPAPPCWPRSTLSQHLAWIHDANWVAFADRMSSRATLSFTLGKSSRLSTPMPCSAEIEPRTRPRAPIPPH